MDWGWPQWVMASLYALTIVLNAWLHGKQRTGEFNVLITILAVSLGAYILHAGGFW